MRSPHVTILTIGVFWATFLLESLCTGQAFEGLHGPLSFFPPIAMLVIAGFVALVFYRYALSAQTMRRRREIGKKWGESKGSGGTKGSGGLCLDPLKPRRFPPKMLTHVNLQITTEGDAGRPPPGQPIPPGLFKQVQP